MDISEVDVVIITGQRWKAAGKSKQMLDAEEGFWAAVAQTEMSYRGWRAAWEDNLGEQVILSCLFLEWC